MTTYKTCYNIIIYSKMQSKLPAAGIVQDESKPASMDEMYDKYVYESTEKNWKFWIVSFLYKYTVNCLYFA